MSGSLLGGIALALVLGTGTIWFRRALAVSLPRNRSGFVVAFAVCLALGVTAFVQGTGWLGGIAAGLACLGSGVFLLLVAISAQKGGSGAFQVGSPVPDFAASDDNGREVAISSLAGKPLLLKFFRGHW